jgi:glycosyltransferase involved in cell wall biosynthesis
MRDIGQLTVGGVDTIKFDSDRFTTKIESLKKNLGIPNANLVIGFVGRLTNDKGIGDFIAMWEIIKNKRENITALVVGSSDARDNFDKKKLQEFFNESRVFYIDFNDEIEKYMAIMDVFVLPSFREGFGNVNVEASSMKIPVVSYNVTGCKDSVKEGYSGFLVEKKNITSLITEVSHFLDSFQKRVKFGTQGRKYVQKHFTRKIVADQFEVFCATLLDK